MRMKEKLKKAVRNGISRYLLSNLPIGYALPLVSFNLFVTYRCNLKCNFCYLFEDDDKENQTKEMTFGEIKKIIDEVSKYKPTICVTGGEPLLRKDIAKIIGYIKSKGCSSILFTNGLLMTEKTAKELIETQLDFIYVSMLGPKEIHEKANNMKSSFEKTINAIKLLKKARDRNKLPKIGVYCTISPFNQDYLYDLAKEVENLKVDAFTYKHLYHSKEGLIKEHNNAFICNFGIKDRGIDKTDVEVPDARKVVDQMKKIMGDNALKKRFYPDFDFDEVFKYYSDCSYPLKKRCLYPWYSASIKPNGDLSICFHNYVIGNLKKKSLNDLWNNKKARCFRKVLLRESYFPACTRCGGLFRF